MAPKLPASPLAQPMEVVLFLRLPFRAILGELFCSVKNKTTRWWRNGELPARFRLLLLIYFVYYFQNSLYTRHTGKKILLERRESVRGGGMPGIVLKNTTVGYIVGGWQGRGGGGG